MRTYAEIIDLPLAVANSPGEMTRAIDELGDVDIVLIDTAGRSPRDEVKIRELADFLAEARPDEVHLVLSAVAGERSLRAAVERFAVVHADRLILTKLDEADGLGGVLAVLGQADRPVSYLTTGQAVPDDIEPADRARLARLILGDEVVDARGGHETSMRRLVLPSRSCRAAVDRPDDRRCRSTGSRSAQDLGTVQLEPSRPMDARSRQSARLVRLTRPDSDGLGDDTRARRPFIRVFDCNAATATLRRPGL